MKQLTTFIIASIIAGAYIITSCSNSLSGEVKRDIRDVKDFTGIELAISGDVFVQQGDTYSVSIEADKDILEKIETKVEGNILRIGTPKGFNLGWDNAKIIINITMPLVEKLAISGSGDIKTTTVIKTESLALSISGSGDISIPELVVGDLKAKISGSGDISVSGNGEAKSAEISVSGSGNVTLDKIKFTDADVSIVGSGDAELHVTGNLNARIVGSGDISYTGKPLVDAKITGSGELYGR